MKADESEASIRTLLENLRATFSLDRSFGDRSLGTHLEEIIREAENRRHVQEVLMALTMK